MVRKKVLTLMAFTFAILLIHLNANTVHIQAATTTTVSVGNAFEYTYDDQIFKFQILSLKGTTNQGTVNLIGVSSNSDVSGDITIPSEVNYSGIKYIVTQIGDRAFYYQQDLTGLTLPESITKIGREAFAGCNVLTAIQLPTGLTLLGEGAFKGCEKLVTITIPQGVKIIEDDLFADCSELHNVVLPQGLTGIGTTAFSDCSALTGISIPNSVTSIGSLAFYNCNKLSSVNLPSGLKEAGQYVFYGCGSLSGVNIPDNIVTEKGIIFTNNVFGIQLNYAILSDPTGASNGTVACKGADNNGAINGNIIIPETVEHDGKTYQVTMIDDSAFEGGVNISGITLPDSIVRIGDRAFYSCKNLSDFIIPVSVQEIGDSAFYHCSSLTSISIPEGITKINDYMFDGCNLLTSVNIPSTVTSIGKRAFAGDKISSITIPNGVTNIDDEAFRNCTSLTGISIPDSVTQLGVGVFSYCTSLINVTLSNAIPDIDNYLFYNCTSIKSITLPLSVKIIGVSAFGYCTALTSITIPNNTQEIGDLAFENCNKLVKCTIPASVSKIGTNTFQGDNLIFSVYKGSSAATYLKSKLFLYDYIVDSSISKIALEAIVITQNNITLNPGEKKSLSVVYYPNNTTDSKTLTWKSSNTAVATVDSYGKVTGVTAGKVTITAYSGAVKYSSTILINPSAPKKVTAASSSYNSIIISWNQVLGATGYRIYRATSASGKYTQIADVTSTTTVKDTKLDNHYTYYYKICTYRQEGTIKTVSVYSTTASAYPILAKPATIKASQVSSRNIKVSWSASSGADGYQVYRATSLNGTYSLVGNTASTAYNDKTVSVGKTYYYKIKAYNMMLTTKVTTGYTTAVSVKVKS